MINISTLTSILEHHKLTDEQSEELQKVIYMLDDGRLAEAKPPSEKADSICVAYLCDNRACNTCGLGAAECKHTTDIRHAKNFYICSESPNVLKFMEKER